jgi:hypothetical protein
MQITFSPRVLTASSASAWMKRQFSHLRGSGLVQRRHVLAST